MFAARAAMLTGSLAPPTVTSVSPSSLSYSQTVTITGTGFLPGLTTVSVNGYTSATNVTVASDGKSLTCTIPSLARGSYTLFVTTPGGTAYGSLTWVNPPSIFSVGTIYAGQTTVYITGQNFTVPGFYATVYSPQYGNNYAYSWSVTSSTAATIESSYPILPKGGSGAVYVYTNDGGAGAWFAIN